jgi:phosphatidylglycerol:prolipoprotein diacylglycerol transferase
VVDVAQSSRLAGVPTAWMGVPLHPSFLYEIVFHFAMFGVLLRLRQRIDLWGELFKVYLLAYGIFRFAVEYTRANDVVWAGLTRSQLFLIPSVLLLAGRLAWLYRRPPLPPAVEVANV